MPLCYRDALMRPGFADLPSSPMRGMARRKGQNPIAPGPRAPHRPDIGNSPRPAIEDTRFPTVRPASRERPSVDEVRVQQRLLSLTKTVRAFDYAPKCASITPYQPRRAMSDLASGPPMQGARQPWEGGIQAYLYLLPCGAVLLSQPAHTPACGRVCAFHEQFLHVLI